MISHNEAQTLISARQDQPLDPLVERELNAHLATCDTCRAFAQSTDALTQGLRSLPYLPASPAVRDAVLGRVEQGRSPLARLSSALGGSFNTAPGPALSTLAIIALVLIVGFFALNRFVLQDGGEPEDNRQQLASQPTQQALATETAEATKEMVTFVEEATATDAATEEPTATATETEAPTEPAAAQTTLVEETETAEPEPTDEPTDEPAPTETEAPEPTDEPAPTATTAPEPTVTTEPTLTETPELEPTATEEEAMGGDDMTNTTMLAPSTPEEATPTEEPVDLTQQAAGEESTPVATPTPPVDPTATPTAEPTATAAATPTATIEPTPAPTATPTTEPEDDEAPPIVPIVGEPADAGEEEPTATTEVTPEPTDEVAAEPTAAATEADEQPQIEPIGGDTEDPPIEGEPTGEATSTPDAEEIQQIEETETPAVTEEAGADDTRDLAEASEPYQDIAGQGDRLLLTDLGRMEFGNVPHAPDLVTDAGRTLEPVATDSGDAVALCDAGGSCVDVSSGTKDGTATDAPIGVSGGDVFYVRAADGVVQYRQATVEGESVVDDVVLLDGDPSIAPQAVYELGSRFWIPTESGSWVLLAEGEGTVAAGLSGTPQLVRFAPSAEPPLIGYVAGGQLIIAPATTPGVPVLQIPFNGVDFDMSPSGDRVAVSDGSSINIYSRDGSLIISYAADDRSPGTLLWLNGGIVYLDTSSGALYQIPETGI